MVNRAGTPRTRYIDELMHQLFVPLLHHLYGWVGGWFGDGRADAQRSDTLRFPTVQSKCWAYGILCKTHLHGIIQFKRVGTRAGQ